MKPQLILLLGMLMFVSLCGYSQSVTQTIPSDSTARMRFPTCVAEDSPLVLKTNLLYDVLLTPSVEAEYRFSPRWSVHADFSMAWWSNKDKHKYYQLMQFSPEARFWLNSKQMWRGHYIGAFVGAGHYDFSAGEEGYQGDFMMAGLSYGYMFPISQRFSLEAGFGIGYMNTEYEEYLPIDDHYVYQQKSRTGYIGPLKAKLSLVWPVGRSKKGDR